MQIGHWILMLNIGGIFAYTNFADIECGQHKTVRNAKIVGGEDAEKAEFPWLVSITRRGGHFCGGTLISNRFVLTAGHCLCTGIGLDLLRATSIKITLSQHDLSEKSEDAYERTIKKVTVHPDYACNKPNNDIAILELGEKLVWSGSVSPACLPVSSSGLEDYTVDNLLATVAGWGWTNELSSKGGRAKVLQKARVNVIENKQCQAWYKSQGKKTKIQLTQICAGHEQGGIDACWADSGGPLMVGSGSPNQMVVVGVVSTGIGCARPFLPGLYTRVSEYIPWIKKVINY
ncbi:trypsin-1 isoform X1 [Coccinella septempunctata]|uniref:trypsin-1 isoform X1 n=1 Tax=Coccinella septempunctata TaxID=41139 RepID=UPI001D089989|nr:trypsin-1 isoform X1 [Coccinella septempunctata]